MTKEFYFTFLKEKKPRPGFVCLHKCPSLNVLIVHVPTSSGYEDTVCPNQKSLGELSYVITNLVKVFLSRICLVIQLCLFVISQGMIAGDVIRLFTFLGQAMEESAAVNKKQASAKEGEPLCGDIGHMPTWRIALHRK